MSSTQLIVSCYVIKCGSMFQPIICSSSGHWCT